MMSAGKSWYRERQLLKADRVRAARDLETAGRARL